MGTMKYQVGDKTFKTSITLDISGGNPAVMDTLLDKTKVVDAQIAILKDPQRISELNEKETKQLNDLLVEKTTLDRLLKNSSNFVKEWAEFKRWSYGSVKGIIRESRVFSPDGKSEIDFALLGDLKLKRLLVAWSLSDIERDENGLTSKCWDEIQKVEPSIINAFLAKANLVLEFGQEEESDFTKSVLQPSLPPEAK